MPPAVNRGFIVIERFEILKGNWEVYGAMEEMF